MDDIVFKLNFQLSPSVKHYYRSIYTLLDFLGDIGGLFDALKALGFFFIFGHNLLFGSILEKHLLSKIFLLDPHMSKGNFATNPEQSLSKQLSVLKPFRLSKKIFTC